MSHTLWRPLFHTPRFAPSIASRRCFSQYRPLAALPTPGMMTAPRASMPKEKSARLQAIQNAVIPSDVGILDKTFITPTGHNLPSFFRELSSFMKLQYNRFYLHGRDAISLLIMKASSPKTTAWYKRQFHISRAQVAPSALALHKQMYTSFASGSIPLIKRICCDGLAETFHIRIANRPKTETVEWELVKYNKRTKVVSHRAARMPLDGSGIRQAVVRIASRQKLSRYKTGKDGKKILVPGSGKEKDVVEYLVVQKIMRDWREEENWKVWGTTRETTLEDVETWERKALE